MRIGQSYPAPAMKAPVFNSEADSKFEETALAFQHADL
jgi:hypothetical protein